MRTTPITLNSEIVAQLPIYDDLMVTNALMDAQEIQADVELPGTLISPIGATIQHKGNPYTINTPPLRAEKLGNRLFKYSVMFESVLYKLYDKKLRHFGNRNFQFYGDPSDYAQLIADNANEIDSGWTVGTCEVLPEKSIDFTGQSCRTSLDLIAEAFGLEWYLDGKIIHFVKQVGNTTTLVFRYGRGMGLYSLSYAYQSDKNIVSRAYGYGSSRNLPKGYRGGATQLMFDGDFLEKNVFKPDGVTKLYGVKEGDYENEDIYPEIAGSVSAVSAFDPDAGTFTITDSTLSFDLNPYFTSETPKLSFKTGELQGQEFEITRYKHDTKTITLKVFTDSNDNKLPNATFQAAIGDTYTLFDMSLPAEYIVDAENRLRVATKAYLDENCVPRVLYSLEIDPLYARDNGILLYPGDKVRIIDEDLGIDELIRVTKTNYSYSFPEVISPSTKITVEIANFIPYTTTERVIADTIDNQHNIKVVDRTNAERARLNALNMKTLSGRIFDPDGNLAKGAETLFAGMAAIGFDSQNFGLIDVTIAPNFGADPNSLVISGGQLVHRTYEVEGIGYTWIITANAWSGLDPAKFYYVYAKCSKYALTGTWEISETPIMVNDNLGFYSFNLGQLFEVNTDGYRSFEFTKGMTYIVGDQITTGTIKSIDSQNYWNLNNGKQNVGGVNDGWDYDVTIPATFTIRNALVAKIIQVGSGGVVNAGISGITDAGTSSVRFWAGSDVAGKGSATFRALDDGTVYMSKARISGDVIIGTESGVEEDGYTTGWSLSKGAILSDGYSYPAMTDGNNSAIIRGSSRYSGDKYNEFSFGTELTPASAGGQVSQVGKIRNNRPKLGIVPGLDDTTNLALELEATGANKNIALRMRGGVEILSGSEVLKGKSGYLPLDPLVPGGPSYTGLRIQDGSIVGYGTYTIADNPPGLT